MAPCFKSICSLLSATVGNVGRLQTFLFCSWLKAELAPVGDRGQIWMWGQAWGVQGRRGGWPSCRPSLWLCQTIRVSYSCFNLLRDNSWKPKAWVAFLSPVFQKHSTKTLMSDVTFQVNDIEEWTVLSLIQSLWRLGWWKEGDLPECETCLGWDSWLVWGSVLPSGSPNYSYYLCFPQLLSTEPVFPEPATVAEGRVVLSFKPSSVDRNMDFSRKQIFFAY